MDPNANLMELLTELSDPIDININRDRVVELLEAQAEWLRSGGFYPTVTSVTPDGTFEVGS